MDQDNRPFSVAIVRNIWTYFYLAPPQATVLQQVRSSIHNHVGLLRLFEDYETDLLTIDDRLWLQRIALEPYYMGSATDKTVLSRLEATKQWAISSATIDWDQYDFVFCLDSVVPTNLMRRYRKPVWAIFLSSPCPSLYALQRWLPLYGFSLAFLDQLPEEPDKNGANAAYPVGQRGFPLSFFRSNDLLRITADAAGKQPPRAPKAGVHIEKHCWDLISPAELAELKLFGPVSSRVDREQYFSTMTERKYFVITHNDIRYLKGHAIIEANGFGCLVLVKRGVKLAMEGLLDGTVNFDTFEDLIRKLKMFETDRKAFTTALTKQQQHIDRYSYELPKSLLEQLVHDHQNQPSPKPGLAAGLRNTVATTLYPLLWIFGLPLYRAAFQTVDRIFGKDLSAVISSFLHGGRRV